MKFVYCSIFLVIILISLSESVEIFGKKLKAAAANTKDISNRNRLVDQEQKLARLRNPDDETTDAKKIKNFKGILTFCNEK